MANVSRLTGTQTPTAIGDESSFGSLASSFDLEWGWIQNLSWNSDSSTQKISYPGGGDNYQAHIDMVETVTGTLEWAPTDGRELEYILGAISGASSPYSITQSTPLPSRSIQDQFSSDKFVELTGVVSQKTTLTLSKGEWAKFSEDFIARKWQYKAGSVSPIEPSVDPFTFLDGTLSMDGTTLASVNNITITIDWKTEGQRAIEDTTAGEKRLITGHIQKICELTIEVEFERVNNTEVETYLGDTQDIQDQRSDISATLTLATGSRQLDINLTGVRPTNISGDNPADGEVRTGTFSSSALGISATVTTS